MVIFVCTANRCRSIISEYLFRKYLQQGLYPPWDGNLEVSSAGILTDDYWEFLQSFAQIGYCNISKYSFYNVPPYKETINCLLAHGWDVSSYRSKPLTEKMVREARLIVTMEADQKIAVLDSFPQSKDKTVTFEEFVGENEAVVYQKTLVRPHFDPKDPHYVYYRRSDVEADYQAIDKGLKSGALNIVEVLRRRG